VSRWSELESQVVTMIKDGCPSIKSVGSAATPNEARPSASTSATVVVIGTEPAPSGVNEEPFGGVWLVWKWIHFVVSLRRKTSGPTMDVEPIRIARDEVLVALSGQEPALTVDKVMGPIDPQIEISGADEGELVIEMNFRLWVVSENC